MQTHEANIANTMVWYMIDSPSYSHWMIPGTWDKWEAYYARQA